MEFNNLGQPCGLKTSRLTNFIASLVKGKEISLASPNWSKVPQSEKDKLWNTVKFFFNIPEVQKSWVLTSARKKFKDFKSYLKIKYFDDELSLRQNIVNGCEGRIPPKQWAWLAEYWYTEKAKARSLKNKETRNSQANALHTTGSRGFAVVHDQEQDINKKLAENPSLIGEEAHEEDLYSTFFPKAKTSARHGLGLVVGGKTSREEETVAGDVKKKGKKKNEEELKLHLEATVSKKLKMEKQEVPKMDKVKLEKAEANIVASNKGKQGWKCHFSHQKVCAWQQLAVQNADANSLGSDGKPLRDYVEVLVNYVCSKTTMLPRAHGRLKKLENAQAKCIPWPRMFINETTKAEFNHVDIYKGHDLLRQRPELYAQIPPECGLKKKRKRTSGAAMNVDDRKTNSQTVDKNQNKERMELEEPEQVKAGAKILIAESFLQKSDRDGDAILLQNLDRDGDARLTHSSD
uniref:Uncharacterized protein n=1 Tax=Avena sativa TaxID=4498 RepID=A0ACD5TYK0_AVESA